MQSNARLLGFVLVFDPVLEWTYTAAHHGAEIKTADRTAAAQDAGPGRSRWAGDGR